MATPRATTIQQRFGFQDKELTTPAHDELMLWLDSEMATVVEALEGEPNIGRWESKHVENLKKRATEAVTNSGYKWAGMNDPPQKEKRIFKKWEMPILSGAYVVGFVDMKVVVRDMELEITNVTERERYDGGGWKLKKGGESPEWKIRDGIDEAYLFEVKPKITSLGELIRQIRMYQAYQGGKYVVVSPDDRMAEQIRAQGILFVKAPDAL